jgi:hypothetical protein
MEALGGAPASTAAAGVAASAPKVRTAETVRASAKLRSRMRVKKFPMMTFDLVPASDAHACPNVWGEAPPHVELMWRNVRHWSDSHL